MGPPFCYARRGEWLVERDLLSASLVFSFAALSFHAVEDEHFVPSIAALWNLFSALDETRTQRPTVGTDENTAWWDLGEMFGRSAVYASAGMS